MSTMTHRVTRLRDIAETPWRNGAGRTRRIATVGGDDGPDWTLSLANIDAGGPFSTFDGLERVALVVGADPLILTVDGDARHLDSLDRVRFAGESVVDATLTRGPTMLLNLMVRRDAGTGELTLQHTHGDAVLDAVEGAAWVVLSGSLTVGGETLAPFDTLSLEQGRLDVSGDSILARVTIRAPHSTPTVRN
ncbi:HutD family protein [Gordonia westfalica]|uniref:HutD family protein n=1 Tax=Gordonia westfalica TaxID=158898 RepID=A0ABU2GN45_9ACTN|nr:HutD family protein [Gordonia westfalica]MDS1112895.1 HutD family protein [Gordonia westfalica]